MNFPRSLTALLAFGIALVGLRAEETPTAAALFERAMDNLGKQEGYHMSLEAESTVDEQGKMFTRITSKGWVRNPDLGIFQVEGLKGAQGTVFHKGSILLDKDAVRDKWWDGKDLPKRFQDVRLANPVEYLTEFRKLSTGASFAADEKIGERACRVVRLEIPTDAIKNFIGKMGILEEAIDWPTAKCSLRFWIGADDTLLLRGVADCEVTVLDADAGGTPTHLTPTAKFEIFDYNQGVGLDQISPGLKEKCEKEKIELK